MYVIGQWRSVAHTEQQQHHCRITQLVGQQHLRSSSRNYEREYRCGGVWYYHSAWCVGVHRHHQGVSILLFPPSRPRPLILTSLLPSFPPHSPVTLTKVHATTRNTYLGQRNRSGKQRADRSLWIHPSLSGRKRSYQRQSLRVRLPLDWQLPWCHVSLRLRV